MQPLKQTFSSLSVKLEAIENDTRSTESSVYLDVKATKDLLNVGMWMVILF